jgi:integrase
MIARYWKPDKGEKFETVTQGNAAVKIYRRTRGKGKAKRVIFEVVDHTGGPGARRLRGFGDHARAYAEAERIARQLSTGAAAAASLTNSDAASYGRALELLAPTGVSLEAATSDYARAFELVGNAIVEAAKFYSTRRPDLLARRTVAEAVAELLAIKEARGKSSRYLADLRERLARFADAFAVDVGTVTTGDVQRFLDGLKLAPQTVKNFRRVLYTLFSFAEARGYIFKGGNPVADTEKVDTNGGGAIEIFTPAELTALLTAAPKAFVPVLAIGAFAGLRTAEIERLEWCDVDLAGGFVHVSAGQAKTRSRRLVPVLPNLAQWLAPYSRQKGKVWKGPAKGLQEARAETVRAAGTPWKHNALRHSFISYRLAEIQNAGQVALEAGNSPAMVFRHYRELVKPEAARAWFAVAPEAPANVLPMPKEAAK